LLSAEGINDRGQIVGYGSFDGQTRAFLLTPTAVPEPSGLALLGVGALAVAMSLRRSKPPGDYA
jgi:probable HAF family extracellular repeat protein